ncbi:cbb3-type cytochrome c oxidase N-terminal domain-containing protein [Adhaeribacter aquaticus]|uniref:cbb3-type cytochrome c oxidase N-terminal domain-containing protein n=1 Tax=Adhaeribacter aquaticus TaxID=299567 RepID=UPI0004154D30|nr:cbb3-type cytochrome c oxidase N-terminal domain-containing protein [Adhaeribacter aquaticus]
MKKNISTLLAWGGGSLLAVPALAQEAASEVPKAADSGLADLPVTLILGGTIAAFILLLLLIFLLINFIMALPFLFKFYGHPTRQNSAMARFIFLFRGDTTTFTGKAADILMEDHSYDGIHEFDNDLPPWWKALFYVTAVFAVIYLVNFHVMGGKLQTAEYEAEMQQAALLKPKNNNNANEKTDYKPLTEAPKLEAGHSSFTQNCAACHGQNGEGMVGPNLTDEFWLHGGDVNDIFKTIKYGVTSKGMVAWQSKLSDDQILEVSSYILSIHGSNPANAKAPQGEKYVAKK